MRAIPSLSALDALKEFVRAVGKPAELLTDQDKVFIGNPFARYCLDNGIGQLLSPAYRASFNGLVERSKSAPAPHAQSSSSLPTIVRSRNESGDTTIALGSSKAPHQLSGKALSHCTFRNLTYAASGP